MFENSITNTKLTGSLGDYMFRRINGCDYEGDVSFTATLRALLMSRMSDDDTLALQMHNFMLENKTAEQCAKFFEDYVCGCALHVVNVTTGNAMIDNAEATKKFCDIPAPDGFVESKDIYEFFVSKMHCRMFINEANKTTIVMILNMDNKKYHLVQCVIPRMIPWLFERGKFSVIERDLLYGLTDRYSKIYEKKINDICDTNAFRQKYTAAVMSSFKRRGLERQQHSIERDINSYRTQIDRMQCELLSLMRKMNDENYKLNGVLTALNSDIESNDELAQFVAANKNIQMVVDQDDSISFIIRGHLDIFDPEAYRTMSRNINSWYWTTGPRMGIFASRENKKKVLDAIFGNDPIFKIKTCGYFRLSGEYGDASAKSRHNYGAEYVDCYPNPHLNYNSCLGAHRAPINKALSAGDMVGAVSQCISSVHSVNVTESASFRYLLNDIFETTTPILDGPENRSYTVAQALEYLNKKEHQDKI